MANSQTQLDWRSPQRKRLTHVILAATIALAAPAAINNPAKAADFRHAKKIIVPASSIPRRYDYNSNTGREAGLPYGYGASSDNYYSQSGGYSTSSTTEASVSSGKSGSGSGLVPPPPPVSPGLLPRSLAQEVPAPPTAPSAVSHAHSGGHSSSNIQHSHTSGDPARSTSIERHATNAPAHKLGNESTVVSHVTARADALVKEGKLQEAQDLLEKYEKSYPRNPSLSAKLSQVSLDRAKYFMRNNDYIEGAKQARLALHYNDSNTEAKHALEQILRHHGIEPNHSANRTKLGDLLFAQGKLKEAHVEYQAALNVDHSPDAYIGLGNIALREHKLKEAKGHYQLALEKNPESSVALRQLGIVRYKLKDVVGANTDLSRALVLNQDDKLASQTLIELWQRQVSMRPNDANSHLGLARAYQLSKDLKSAQNSYRTVVSIDPNHPNLPAARQSFKLALAREEAQKTYEAAKTLDANGAINEALAKATDSVNLSPGDVKFRLYQADLTERVGNYPEAKRLYLEVLRQDSKNLIAAQRIKALSDMLVPGDPATDGQIGLKAHADSLSNLLAPPPAEQGATQGSLTSMIGTPQLRGEGPALPTLPGAPKLRGPSPDPVNNMTGFLSDLRNYMFVQKKELSKQEDQILENIGAKSKSDSLGGSSSSLKGLGELPPLPGLPKKLISSDDIQKLLAGTSSSSSSKSKSSSKKKGASSAKDISDLLAGSSTASGSSAAELPPLPKGVQSEDLARLLQSASASGNPSLSSLSSLSSSSQRFTSPSDVIMSNEPRQSETVLKVPDAPAPQVAPPISKTLASQGFTPPKNLSAAPQASAATPQVFIPQGFDTQTQTFVPPAPQQGMEAQAQAFTPPQTNGAAPQVFIPQGFNTQTNTFVPPTQGLEAQTQAFTPPQTPQVFIPQGFNTETSTFVPPTEAATPQTFSMPSSISGVDVQALAAQAKNLSPQALSGIARSLGMNEQQMSALASQTPQLINQKIANLKPEDMDKAYQALRQHVVKKQEQLKVAQKPTKGVTAKTVNSKKTAPVKSAPARTAKSASTPSSVAHSVPNPKTAPTPAELPQQTANAVPQFQSPAPLPNGDASGLGAAAITGESLSALPAAVPPAVNTERLDTLEAQNKDLQSQLENTRRELQELRENLLKKPSKPVKAAKGSRSKNSSKASSDIAPANSTGSAATGFEPQANAITSGAVPQAMNTIAALPQAVQAVANAAPSLNLELTGVSVKPTSVRLNVVLRNGTGQPVALPQTAKAIVRMVGEPDQIADVKFPTKSITAGQEIKGYITVSGHKLDPAADVFIPRLMRTESGTRDVHLTVPISALAGVPTN